MTDSSSKSERGGLQDGCKYIYRIHMIYDMWCGDGSAAKNRRKSWRWQS